MTVDDISHFIESLEMKGQKAFATIRVLPTHQGRNVLAIIRNGGSIGVSARGLGETKNEGGVDVVQDNYEIQGLDFVLNPSFPMFADRSMVRETMLSGNGRRSMILESAPLDQDAKLDEETERQKMKDKYYAAIRLSGFRGDFETFRMAQDRETMDKVSKTRERYAQALKAGYKGTETEYFDAMEK